MVPRVRARHDLTRVAFVYPNPRAELAAEVARLEAPDTALLGQNHLGAFGIDAFVHDSAVRRVHLTRGAAHRVTWLLREATVPWEVRRADILVTPLATILPLVARLRRRPRVVLLSYGIGAQWRRAGVTRRRLIAASLGAADRVVTIASSARPELARIGGLASEDVDVVPFGVDEAFWRPAAPARGGHVLTVGRDLARDYKTFAAALAGSELRGIIVAKEENLRGVALSPNVEVKQFIPFGALRRLYAEAACVVVPLVPDADPRGTESSGNTAMLEAMACGHAPVVTDRAPLRDYLTPETATTVGPADASALRQAIERVTGDHERALEMGAAARRRIEEGFTTRSFAGRLAALLREVA